MDKEIGVGIIGSGLRGALVMGLRMVDLVHSSNLRVRALCDRIPERLEETKLVLEMSYQFKQDVSVDIATYEDYKALVDDPNIDLILVTTPTYFHKEPTEYALASGKKVYLDKPIAVTLSDSLAILEAEEKASNPIIMGFTRRFEISWRKAYSLLQEGAIGELQLINLRSVIPYTRYLHFWHRRNEKSGGALNDKSSHHYDVFNWMTGERPEALHAFGGRSSIFKEDPTAPERCSLCDRDCPYDFMKGSEMEQLKEMGVEELPQSWANPVDEEAAIDTCVFKPGADIYDHVVSHVKYPSGVLASLTLCIFGPDVEDQETLELIGTKGRLRLTRGRGEIDLVSDFGKTHEVIYTRTEEFESSHYGADLELVRELEKFSNGKSPLTTAADGHESLRMIHATFESIENNGKTVDLRGELDEQL